MSDEICQISMIDLNSKPYAGFSDPCGVGLDGESPGLVHIQDLPQQRHLVSKSFYLSIS